MALRLSCSLALQYHEHDEKSLGWKKYDHEEWGRRHVSMMMYSQPTMLSEEASHANTFGMRGPRRDRMKSIVATSLRVRRPFGPAVWKCDTGNNVFSTCKTDAEDAVVGP